MKTKPHENFHNANIYNSDDDAYSWMDDLDPTLQNGQQVVFAKGVAETAIGVYDADVANHIAPHAAAQRTAAVAVGTLIVDAQ